MAIIAKITLPEFIGKQSEIKIKEIESNERAVIEENNQLLKNMGNVTGRIEETVNNLNNKYDELAILVKDQNDNKLGYVPRKKNPILARLMDAGKLIYGTVKTINNDDSYINIEMEIFMDD